MRTKDEENELNLRSEKTRRDDFTWMLLLFESLRNRKKRIPLGDMHQSYYGRPNTYSSLGFRFSDQKQAEEEERKRRRRTHELDLAYAILVILMTVVLAILIH